MARRIIVAPPAHPGVMAILLAILLAPLLWGAWLPAALLLTLAPLHMAWAAPAALALLAASPILGFINVVVHRRRTYVTVIELDYVRILGIPVPIAKPKLEGVESLIALNLGGAVVPAAIAAGVVAAEAAAPGPTSLELLAATGISFALTAYATYRLSRVVPGVGVTVPGIVPPIISIGTAAIAAVPLGLLRYVPAIAYVAAVLGTLVGADVLNILRRGDELGAWLVSIGGAGTFDGIFMSGVLAILLASLLI